MSNALQPMAGSSQSRVSLHTSEGATSQRCGSSTQSTETHSGSSIGQDSTPLPRRKSSGAESLFENNAQQKRAKIRYSIKSEDSFWSEATSDLSFEGWSKHLLDYLKHKNTFAVVRTQAAQRQICIKAMQFFSKNTSGTNNNQIIIISDTFDCNVATLHKVLRSEFPTRSVSVEGNKISLDGALTLVTTPICLHQALINGRIRLQRKALMIFLIASDPTFWSAIPQMLAQYYKPLSSDERPRILVLALSSVVSDALSSQAPIVLSFGCSLFKAKYFTSAMDADNASRFEELTIFYEPQVQVFRTPLLQKIIAADIGHLVQKQIKRAKVILRSLGPAACDLMWGYVSEDLSSEGLSNSSLEKIIDIIRRNIPTIKPCLTDFPPLVSPKINVLVKILQSFKSQGEMFRGIVLVQHRVIAELLSKLLTGLWTFLRPYAVFGSGEFSDPTTQQCILSEFCQGSINLIITTRSFEDIEYPAVTCVVTFDLLDSYVAYANARALAEKNNCHYIIMAERLNDVHRRILKTMATADRRMSQWFGSVTQFVSSPPPITLQEGSDPYRSESETEDTIGAYIRDSTTNARIYPTDAVSVIYKLVSGLNLAGDGASHWHLFRFIEVTDLDRDGILEYVCTIMIPSADASEAPKSFSGAPCLSRSLARRTACFQLCQDLRNKGLLDSRLYPRGYSHLSLECQRPPYLSPLIQDELDVHEDDAVPGVGYPRLRPQFWSNSAEDFVGKLFPVGIVFEHEDEQNSEYPPLLLMTRLPIPPVLSFKLYTLPSVLQCRILPMEPFTICIERLESLEKYTKRLLRALMFRSIDCSDTLPYFLAPLKTQRGANVLAIHQRNPLPDGENCIDWNSVFFALNHIAIPLRSRVSAELRDELDDSILQIRLSEFSRKYEALDVRQDLNPYSPANGNDGETYLGKLIHGRKDFEGLRDRGQPLIRAKLISPPVNFLTPTSDSKEIPVEEMLIPELSYRLTIPASMLRTAQLLPSVMRRLDDILLMKEFNAAVFDHKLAEKYLQSALTLPSAGMDINHERLEFLGDAFLKYASSVYLYSLQTQQSEGVMHILRQSLISNNSLLKNAIRCGLPLYIQSRSFVAKSWIPTGFETQDNNKGKTSRSASTSQPLVSEETRKEVACSLVAADEGSKESDLSGNPAALSPSQKRRLRRQKTVEELQRIPDKSVADVMEALLGAAYLTGGTDLGLWAAKRMNIPFLRVDRWDDFSFRPLPSTPEGVNPLPDHILKELQRIIGHSFSNPLLLAQALTHRTKILNDSQIASYDRLEFLGDAILDFITSVDLFQKQTEASPGMLTSMRSTLVSNNTLGTICVYYGLHRFLVYQSSSIGTQIRNYEIEIRRRQMFEDEQLSLGRKKSSGGYWAETESPKVLSDMLEAIMGAIFVSDGFRVDGVQMFFNNILKPFFDRYIEPDDLAVQPTHRLSSLLDARGCHRFQITKVRVEARNFDSEPLGQYLSEVILHDIVLARAWDVTAQAASRRCAILALDALEGDPAFLNNCNCRDKRRSS